MTARRRDTGIVRSTEVMEARKHGRRVEGVAIPAPLNMASVVGHATGDLKTGRNQANARAYPAFPATDRAQTIYREYGFGTATAEVLRLKAVP